MDDVTLRDTTIEDSIVFPKSIIESSTVSESIIDTEEVTKNMDRNNALVGPFTKAIGNG